MMIRNFSSADRAATKGTGEIADITDYSGATIRAICARIEQSHTFEHLVYREMELDEVWRLVEADLADARRCGAPASTTNPLETLLSAVVAAHDMMGDSRATGMAAERLRHALP